MKKKALLLAVIGVMSMSLAMSLAAMAASPVVKVRVVDVTAYGQDKLESDAGIVSAATVSIAQDPKVYPAIGSLVFTVGKNSVNYAPDAAVPAGALKFSGSIGDKEPFEFTSLSFSDRPGKFDAAIVGRDGKVTYPDTQVVIDYTVRSITTVEPLTVKDGDTILIFVKEGVPISPEKRETILDHYQNDIPGTLTNDQDHGGGSHGGGNGKG